MLVGDGGVVVCGGIQKFGVRRAIPRDFDLLDSLNRNLISTASMRSDGIHWPRSVAGSNVLVLAGKRKRKADVAVLATYAREQ
jgi:hypothetical protein